MKKAHADLPTPLNSGLSLLSDDDGFRALSLRGRPSLMGEAVLAAAEESLRLYPESESDKQHLMHHREESNFASAGLTIADAIEALKEQLLDAQERHLAGDDRMPFTLGDVELEFEGEFVSGGSDKIGFSISVFGCGIGVDTGQEEERRAAHRVRITLHPIEGGVTLGPKSKPEENG